MSLNAKDAVDRRLAAATFALWPVFLGLAWAALSFGLGPLPSPVSGAIAIMAVPAFATASLRLTTDSLRSGVVLLMLWAAAGAGACALTGGLSGPLTAWCLAPVAAATALGRRRLLAEAAALAVLGGSLAALVQIAGWEPAVPTEPLRLLLSLMSLGSLGLSLAAGLARFGRDGPLREDDRSEFEQILMNQPHLVLSLSREGQVLSAYGYPPPGVAEAALRKGLTGIVAPADHGALADAMDAALRGGALELICGRAGDPERSVAVSLRASDDGRLFALLRDATAQLAHERKLVEAKTEAEALNASKSRFLANMSHELRTPLNTIMGFSDIMRARLFGPMSAKYGEYADLIHDAGAHLLDLINDVLDVSKIEAESFQLQIERFDARDPVAAALRLVRVQADEAGLYLRASLPPTTIAVEADPRALKQIALNLLSNALKFTPRGGQVTISLQTQDADLELVVADTGVGIAPEDIKRLGRPYVQAGDASQRARGAGLGLSLVRGLAELHGGEMILESALGEGTSVLVRFPGCLAAVDEDRPSAQVIAFNPGR